MANRLGKHPYGYTSFWFDITDKIKFGEKNIIAVQVMNEGQNSRWYSGSGIYRHVWLKMLETDPCGPMGNLYNNTCCKCFICQSEYQNKCKNEDCKYCRGNNL